MKENELKKWMIQNNMSVKTGTLEDKLYILERIIKHVLKPQSRSDKTCFRNVIEWLMRKILCGVFCGDEIFSRFIDNIIEASGPESRNPRAVFISILKAEYNYPK